jgi:hypothetical protein
MPHATTVTQEMEITPFVHGPGKKANVRKSHHERYLHDDLQADVLSGRSELQ